MNKKHLIRNVYCFWCKSKKTCGKLDEQKKYCCSCYSQEILAELEKEKLLISSAQQALNNYRSGVIACQQKRRIWQWIVIFAVLLSLISGSALLYQWWQVKQNAVKIQQKEQTFAQLKNFPIMGNCLYQAKSQPVIISLNQR